MTLDKTVIILLGIQGSGKGTQAKLLSQRINAPILEAGEILRQKNQSAGSRSKIIAEYIRQGLLVPDEIIFNLIKKNIAQLNCDKIILDGFPRTLAQKKKLDRLLKKFNYKNIIVIYIHLSDDEAYGRLKLRSRTDDNDQSIKNRINIYHTQTEPIIATYKNENRLVEINGSPSIKKVSKSIIQAIDGADGK